MSILSATTAEQTLGVIVVAFLLISLGLMGWLGVFFPRRIAAPLRLPLDEPAMPVMLTMIIAGSLWFGLQVIYLSFKQVGQNHPMSADQLTPGDYAFLSTVPGVLAFFALLAGDMVSGREIVRQLGLHPKGFLRGMGLGLLGILIVWPLVFWAMELCEWLYRYIAYEHPMEHELLKSLGESHNSAIKIGLVIGASIIAPFFEEYFFRAHFQTLLKRALIVLSQPKAKVEARGFAVVPPAEELILPPLRPFVPEPEHYGFPPSSESITTPQPTPVAGALDFSPEGDRPIFVWQTWVALLVTSALFAAIHPGWSIPGIFVLALGLGYIYERTGNLWASITMHLLFNSANTIIFVYGTHGG